MSRETVMKRNVLVAALLSLACLGVLILVQNLPEIRREIKIWMM